MIIDYAVYHGGQRTLERSEALTLRAAVESMSDSDFIWVGLHEPTKDEFDHIGDVLNLHPLAIEDAVNAHQRPKIERYPDHLFVVVKTLWYTEESDDVDTGEINAFLGTNFLLTVRHGEGQSLVGVREAAERNAALLGHGSAAALYAVLDAVVDQYESVAADLEIDVDEVEASVFSSSSSRDSDRIYRLKREVLEFRRAIAPLKEPLLRVVEGRYDLVQPDSMPFFRDVADHLVRVADSIDSTDHLLDNALNAHMARLSVQQNDDMRKLSAGAALFAVPTMIAGVYGMNFEHMPELSWRFGYPLCVALMLGLCGILYRAFRRSGWL